MRNHVVWSFTVALVSMVAAASCQADFPALVPNDQDEAGYAVGETSARHTLTATFADPEEADPEEAADTEEQQQASAGSRVSVTDDLYPPIPQQVTSFGAAVAAGGLYLYGGHTGRAHEYHVAAQANTLWRLDLRDPKSWESLGTGPRLQGLAMVAHGGKLYRLGGFTARNREGAEQDLWSQAGVDCYDPATGAWQALPPLPEPRSSFDAAVLGDRIYVVGGWTLQGGGETTWLRTAHMLDLSRQPLQWQPLPAPPFQRRALSVAAHDGKLFVLGGMQRTGGPTTRVDVFAPESQAWSRGPDLQGEGMDGFGSAAFAVSKQLFVTTYSGNLQRLSATGDAWEVVATLERDRFFHRLLPLGEHQLLAIGGASMSSGKFAELDVINLRDQAEPRSGR